jgi:5-aminopentanamidase
MNWIGTVESRWMEDPLSKPRPRSAIVIHEDGIFVATTNTVGADDMYRYFGRSAVVDPQGNIVARAGKAQEIVVTDLDLSKTGEAQRGSPYLDRRRPSLYASLARS